MNKEKNISSNKKMNIEEVIDLESEALAKTICEYCTDNYIRSYANKLSGLHYPSDESKIKFIVTKLFNWYKTEIDNIVSQEYISSKESHIKSYQLLEEMVKIL
jgi:hypothetical protein